jgi:hypothetical protein
MPEQTRLRVFEDTDGNRYVRQFTQAEVTAHLAENETVTLVR